MRGIVQERQAQAEERARSAAASAEQRREQRAARAAAQAAEEWCPQVGDVVEVPALGQTARVTRRKGKNRIAVAIGGLSMEVKVAEVLRVE